MMPFKVLFSELILIIGVTTQSVRHIEFSLLLLSCSRYTDLHQQSSFWKPPRYFRSYLCRCGHFRSSKLNHQLIFHDFPTDARLVLQIME